MIVCVLYYTCNKSCTQRDKCKETENVIKPDCATLTFKQCGLKINKRFRWTKEAVILIYNDIVRENPRQRCEVWGGGQGKRRIRFVYCKPWWHILWNWREWSRERRAVIPPPPPPHCFSGLVGNEAITAAVKREAAKWKVKEGILLLIRFHILSPSLQFSISLSSRTHTHTRTNAGELGT